MKLNLTGEPDDTRRPAPEPEDPAEREAREKLGCGRSEWRALQGANCTIDDYRRAIERDRLRAERKRGKGR